MQCTRLANKTAPIVAIPYKRVLLSAPVVVLVYKRCSVHLVDKRLKQAGEHVRSVDRHSANHWNNRRIIDSGRERPSVESARQYLAY